VRSPNPARMSSIRALIAKLDTQPLGSATNGNIWVVHLKNADSAKLATVLRAAFSAAGGAGGGGGGGGSSTSAPLGANPAGTGGTANVGAANAAAAPISPSAGPSTGGFIQADPATNSLIITAPEPLYRQVRAMIDQLDERRAQVYIESLIVEVTGDNAADFGFQWQGLLTAGNRNNALVGGTNFGTNGNLLSITQAQLGASGGVSGGTSAGGISLGEGLNIGLVHNFFGTYGLAAIARLLQSQTNTNIASTPNLVTLDNEEAKIVVGSNVPFVTGQFTNTGVSTSSPFQTIERKDVGITLRIRPQIGENGTIRMTIFQESSSLSSQVAPGTSNAGPSTNKRSIESNVVVDDGQILVLGGLIEDRYTDNNTKVPLLGDIPYVGALFRSENRTKTRTNLMVFLRPVVMRDAETANRISVERYEQIRGFQKEMQPKPSVLVPINDSPVIPPMRRLDEAGQPLAAPQSSPGTTKPALPARPQPEPDAAATVVVPVIVAPPASAPASAPRN
jgi:general secretion pathway protein D